MRILIVIPRQPQATGNQITARRHQEELLRLGHEVILTMTAEDDSSLLCLDLKETRPDLVHLLHAYRSGRPWLDCVAAHSIPCVVTLTGTDINHDIFDPVHGPVVRAVLDRAAVIISQNPRTVAELKHNYPQWRPRLRHIPPGVSLGSTPFPLRRIYDVPDESVLFFHPAGIRPVKGNLELLLLFDRVAVCRRGFRVAFCGPILDQEYASRFFAALSERPWALYLEVVPSTAMAAALKSADVVLNHSVSEGMSNALLEAAALGRPLLVRDIPGNAAVVEGGNCGLLYRSEEEFVALALALIDEPSRRQQLCRPQPGLFSPAAEALALCEVYREAVERWRG